MSNKLLIQSLIEQLAELNTVATMNPTMPLKFNETDVLHFQRNIILKDISKSLKLITEELKRSNDTVDILNAMTEEESQQIELDFDTPQQGDDDVT